MKTVLVLTLVIALLVASSIGCLMIFEVFTLVQGAELLLKSLAALILLGVTSAAIAFIASPATTSSR